MHVHMLGGRDDGRACTTLVHCLQLKFCMVHSLSMGVWLVDATAYLLFPLCAPVAIEIHSREGFAKAGLSFFNCLAPFNIFYWDDLQDGCCRLMGCA